MSAPRRVARVLLADDHDMVREGLAAMLEREPDLHVVAQAADGHAAFNRLLQGDIDLAILDISMPRLTGLQVARRMKEHRIGAGVLILSMHDDEQFFFEALQQGASGYMLKKMAPRDLVNASRAVLRGEPFIYPPALAAVMRGYLQSTRERKPGERLVGLSGRETEVVKLIAEGYSAREIAEQLVISEKTVERHRSNILEKLRLKDRVALTRYAIKRGLIEP